MIKNNKNKITNDKGAAALEFALVIPILLFMLFGIIEFGVIFSEYQALQNAAREGARLASQNRWNQEKIIELASPYNPTITITPTNYASMYRGEYITVTLTDEYDWTLLPINQNLPLKVEVEIRKE